MMTFRKILHLISIFVILSGTVFSESKKPDGKGIFNSRCVACHTIGKGKLIGPDLKDVTKRRKIPWIKKMIKNPESMIKTDPIAQQLLKEYNNVPMISLGLTDAEIEAVVSYLKNP